MSERADVRIRLRAAGLPIAVIGAIALAAGSAAAGYQIGWSSVYSGAVSFGNHYALGGTVGQSVAGASAGGGYTLTSGYNAVGGKPAGVAVPGPGAGAAPVMACALHAPMPNPAVDRTTIAFDLPHDVFVRVRVYDTSGRVRRELASAFLPAGRYQRRWDGADDGGRSVPPGLYFVRMDAGGVVLREKLVVTR